jgi:hypothetical protein
VLMSPKGDRASACLTLQGGKVNYMAGLLYTEAGATLVYLYLCLTRLAINIDTNKQVL